MLILDNHYFKPTTKLRTLALLEAVASDGRMSQQDMACRTALSIAMVNQYIRGMESKGLLRCEPVNGKSYRYLLAEEGQRTRREYFGQYCAEIVQSYTTLKNMVQQQLSPLLERGLTRLVLYGASETCEVVLSSLTESGFTVVALVDSDPSKQGKMFRGHLVSPPEALDRLECDAVVITSFGRQEEIYRQLAQQPATQQLEIVRL
jgi:DNA-binding MarR family transcriptional regulator